MASITVTREIDLSGIVGSSEMTALFHISATSLRQRVARGTFPIPVIDAMDRRLRWWGPTVQLWIDEHMPADGRPVVRAPVAVEVTQ